MHYIPNEVILKQTIDPEAGYAVREIFFTKKGNDVFAIVPKWPKDKLEIRDIELSKNTQITLLGSDIKIDFEQIGKDIILKTPCLSPDELPSKYAYAFKISQ